MSFDKTFHELRQLRRLPMTAWAPQIPSPYINDIEKKGLIPSEEKLELLTALFTEVAREQKAVDPEEDAKLLERERERSFLTRRAKLDPSMVDLHIEIKLKMTALSKSACRELLETVSQAVDGFEAQKKLRAPASGS
jgi:hypothetical protein